MSHGIMEHDKAFYGNREPAWHRLGTVIDEDVVTSGEAIRLAGLNWTVEQHEICVHIPNGDDMPDSMEQLPGANVGVEHGDHGVILTAGQQPHERIGVERSSSRGNRFAHLQQCRVQRDRHPGCAGDVAQVGHETITHVDHRGRAG